MSISLGSDNHSGVHPRIMQKLIDLNHGHAPAYGTDEITQETEKLIKQIFGSNCEPYFVFNGTAANVLCLQALIQSFEGVIASDVSHLHVDECAAPEKALGSKIYLCPHQNGKIQIADMEKFLIRAGDQHYAQPRVVSLTQPTELGTCYSLEELKEIRAWTKKHQLFLHIDGARLIYAAHTLGCSLADLTGHLGVDMVSFGGTKNGLLYGEIILAFHPQAQKYLKFIRKQNMQLPSKMRFLAGQFLEFLNPGAAPQPPLWQEIAQHGHQMALYLQAGLAEFPEVRIAYPVQANSVFVQIPRDWLKPLRQHAFFYVWDEHEFIMRWMLSFDVQQKDIDAFLATMRKLKRQL